MKAKIYGHDVEGSPEELAKFKQHLDEQIAKLVNPYRPNEFKFYPPYTTPTTAPITFRWNEVTCGSISCDDYYKDTIAMNYN